MPLLKRPMLIALILLAVLVVAHVAAALVATRVIVASINADNPATGMFVPVEGGRLHLQDVGPRDLDEPVILLLHGATGNSGDMMMALGKMLSAKHRVIAVDRPGHGHSDRPDGRADASPAAQAGLIAQALQSLGVKRVVVVGFSWSGALAVNLALDHKERVAGLVLLAPVTHPWPGGIASMYTLASRPVIDTLFTELLVTPVGAWGFRDAVSRSFAPGTMPENYITEAQASLILRPEEFRWNGQDVAALHDFVSQQHRRNGEITVPTTIIADEGDVTVSAKIHARAIAEQIAGSKLILVQNAGHMVHFNQRELVQREIETMMAIAK